MESPFVEAFVDRAKETGNLEKLIEALELEHTCLGGFYYPDCRACKALVSLALSPSMFAPEIMWL